MQVSGKVIAVSAIENGTSKTTGQMWQKCGFTIEVPGQHPERAFFTLFGDKVSQCPAVDENVVVDFNFGAREYNGRWYNDLQAWKVTRPQQMGVASREPDYLRNAPRVAENHAPQSNDNLPF